MTKIIGFALYLIIGFVNLFFWGLALRLDGVPPQEVYSKDNNSFAFLIYAMTPISLPIVIIYFILHFFKKYMIAGIEIIVAAKTDQNNEEDSKKHAN